MDWYAKAKFAAIMKSMLDPRDMNDLVNAVNTRDAIEQARNRQFYGTSTIPSNLEGLRYASNQFTSTIPLYSENGEAFLGSLLKKDLALHLSQDVREGAVVEYKDEAGQYYYGEVQKSNSKNSGKVVKNLKPAEVAHLKETNPDLKIYSLTSSNVKEVLTTKKSLSNIMGILDPGENLFFKVMTSLLLGEILETTSLTDLFMQIYIRLVALAFIVIVIAYTAAYIMPA